MLKFKDNPDVMFADINLSEGGPGNSPKTGNLNGGAGGWPTILHFNKKTGFKGSSYAADDKKTQMPMCDELGPNCAGDKRCQGQGGFLQAHVEEKGNTMLCQAKPPFKGCGKESKGKMMKVLKKYVKKSPGAMEAKLDKLYSHTKSKQWSRYPPADQLWIQQQISVIEFVKAEKVKKNAEREAETAKNEL